MITGDIVYGNLFCNGRFDCERIIITDVVSLAGKELKGFACRVIPETIQFFSGFYDKDDKAVYEGDILDALRGSHVSCSYDEEQGCWRFTWTNLQKYDPVLGIKPEYVNTCRIVDNLLDNPKKYKKYSH